MRERSLSFSSAGNAGLDRWQLAQARRDILLGCFRGVWAWISESSFVCGGRSPSLASGRFKTVFEMPSIGWGGFFGFVLATIAGVLRAVLRRGQNN